MNELLQNFVSNLSHTWLAVVTITTIAILGKAADGLVTAAVSLSQRLKVPKFVIGSTIVSLGTTTPEAVISVMAAIKGSPGLALGNAVGSIICDTGLILGICCLITRLKVDSPSIRHSSWLQLGAGFLLVGLCFPWSSPASVFVSGGTLSQYSGFFLVALLVVYLLHILRRKNGEYPVEASSVIEHLTDSQQHPSVVSSLVLLFISIVAVIGSSSMLIACAIEAAHRLAVPEAAIAATLVALGTSFPELVTAVTATIKGHGELALGNIIGADILNVLFVAGAAAAVTPGGLPAGQYFFGNLFISMLAVLIVFKLGIHLGKRKGLGAGFGCLLLGIYAITIWLSY